MNSELGTTHQALGLEEFTNFAAQTYHELVILDESNQWAPKGAKPLPRGQVSDMRIYCRLDISVYYNTELKQYKYFVNEAAVNHKAVLFLHYIYEAGPASITDLALALHGLVAYHRASIKSTEIAQAQMLATRAG